MILPLKAFLVNTHPPITKYVKGEKLEFSKVKFNPKIGCWYCVNNEEKYVCVRNGILWIGEQQDIEMSIDHKSKNGLLRFISERNGRLIRPIFRIFVSNKGKRKYANALFDTGSNKSGITKEFAEQLELKKIDRGVIIQDILNNRPIYLIDFNFGENIKYTNVQTIEVAQQPLDPFDVLIGMDILGTGNFTVESSSRNTRIIFEVRMSENKNSLA